MIAPGCLVVMEECPEGAELLFSEPGSKSHELDGEPIWAGESGFGPLLVIAIVGPSGKVLLMGNQVLGWTWLGNINLVT